MRKDALGCTAPERWQSQGPWAAERTPDICRPPICTCTTLHCCAKDSLCHGLLVPRTVWWLRAGIRGMLIAASAGHL